MTTSYCFLCARPMEGYGCRDNLRVVGGVNMMLCSRCAAQVDEDAKAHDKA